MADQRVVPERLVGERIGGRFVIERLIGAGPLSSAFRARDELLQRRVTVKLFHPQHRDDVAVVESQLDLASAVARLSHPNIVTVIDRGEHEGLPFVVLEYVRGENLHERIDRYAPLRVGEVVGYGIAIARALAYAHAQHVVHGNLRPANVLISEEREVKLVDFGGGSFVASLTGDPYVAPERRAAPEHQYDAAPSDDVYALGMLLYAALTEQQGGAARIDAATVQMLRPDASSRLAAVIARATAADPEERFAAMHEFASELANVRLPAGDTADAPGAARPTNGNGSSLGPGDVQGAAGRTAPFAALEPIDARAAEQTTVTRAVAGAGRGGRGSGGDAARAMAPRRDRGDRGARRPARDTRARMVAWSMVLLPVAAVVLVGTMVAGERGHGQRTSKAGSHSAVQLVDARIAAISSFDPPPGDRLEKQDLVQNLIDGNPATRWETEGYNDEYFSKLKPGVGFYVTLEQPAKARGVSILTDLNGWTAEVYGADLPGAALSDWKSVSKPTRIVNGHGIDVDTHGHAYKSYLVWITHLAVDDKFRARAGEVRVRVPA